MNRSAPLPASEEEMSFSSPPDSPARKLPLPSIDPFQPRDCEMPRDGSPRSSPLHDLRIQVLPWVCEALHADGDFEATQSLLCIQRSCSKGWLSVTPLLYRQINLSSSAKWTSLFQPFVAAQLYESAFIYETWPLFQVEYRKMQLSHRLLDPFDVIAFAERIRPAIHLNHPLQRRALAYLCIRRLTIGAAPPVNMPEEGVQYIRNMLGVDIPILPRVSTIAFGAKALLSLAKLRDDAPDAARGAHDIIALIMYHLVNPEQLCIQYVDSSQMLSASVAIGLETSSMNRIANAVRYIIAALQKAPANRIRKIILHNYDPVIWDHPPAMSDSIAQIQLMTRKSVQSTPEQRVRLKEEANQILDQLGDISLLWRVQYNRSVFEVRNLHGYCGLLDFHSLRDTGTSTNEESEAEVHHSPKLVPVDTAKLTIVRPSKRAEKCPCCLSKFFSVEGSILVRAQESRLSLKKLLAVGLFLAGPHT